jgi:general stress protein YciG
LELSQPNWLLVVEPASLTQTMEKQMANEQRGGSGNFANNPQRASEAGKKGGEHSQGGSQGGGRDNPGNFANDREKASEAGRKGGQH